MRSTGTIRIVAVAALAALVTVAACSTDSRPTGSSDRAAPANGRPVARRHPNRRWLFAIQSEGPTSYDAATGTLAIPTKAVQAFTDRPHRDTRVTSPQSFADLWGTLDPGSFAKDPPNAVLTYWENEAASTVPRTAVCEVTGKVGYSAGNGTLSMAIRLLDPKAPPLPQHLYRASLFVDDISAPCVRSVADETSVEYFNEMLFEQEFQLVVQQLPDADDSVQLICPQRLTPTIPSPTFDVDVATLDQTQTASCYTGATLTLDPTASPTPEDGPCSAGVCEVVVTARDRETDTIYSTTLVRLDLAGVTTARTITPQLQAATLPICPALLAGQSEQPATGPLVLCDDPSSCSGPGGSGTAPTITWNTAFLRPGG